MRGHVLRQPNLSRLPFPILVGGVRVRDLAAQGVRIFAGDAVHLLRPRAGKFVYKAGPWGSIAYLPTIPFAAPAWSNIRDASNRRDTGEDRERV